MHALKWLLISFFLVFLAAGLITGYLFFVRPLTLPIYHMDQQLQGAGDFSATTLTLGNSVFISGADEFPLEMTAAMVSKLAMIGRTQDGMEIYPVPGQDPQDFIMLTTFMFPRMVFRSVDLPPLQPGSFPVDEIQVMENELAGTTALKTGEAVLITEVINRLTGSAEAAGKVELVKTTHLRLVSSQYPGLYILVYAGIDRAGSVLLAEKIAPDRWIPAGPAFTHWMAGGK